MSNITITSILGQIKENMCDNYCKMLDEYLAQYEDPDDAHERMMEERCINCPLNMI